MDNIATKPRIGEGSTTSKTILKWHTLQAIGSGSGGGLLQIRV